MPALIFDVLDDVDVPCVLNHYHDYDVRLLLHVLWSVVVLWLWVVLKYESPVVLHIMIGCNASGLILHYRCVRTTRTAGMTKSIGTMPTARVGKN